MRRALVVLLLVSACGGSSQPASRVIADCVKPSYKPTDVLVACGDGGVRLSGVTYSSWTASKALGTGVVEANDCTPDCAEGHFKTYPATFVFDGLRSSKGRQLLTRLTIRYTGANPNGDAEETLPLNPSDDLPRPAASS